MARPALASIRIATPERLLSAAEGVFADEGLNRAKLADIAAAAGITRASLLYHFESKEALHAAVVSRALDALAEILTSAMEAEGAFAVRLDGIVESFHTFVEEHPSLARILVREVVDGNATVVALARPLLDSVAAFVTQEHPDPASAAVGRAAMMMVISDAMLHAASAPAARILWGTRDAARPLSRRVLGIKEN